MKHQGEHQEAQDAPLLTCGIIMPIGGTPEYPIEHWSSLYEIFSEAIVEAKFKPNLVSSAQESAIIHKTIVQNLYMNELILCDVSSKNPNVMLELGMRLAFDKPVVIVKDDATNYAFDTSPIKYIEYSKDTKYDKIREFKRSLAKSLRETIISHEKGSANSFLKAFGEFKIPKIESKETETEVLIFDEIRKIKELLNSGLPKTETLRSGNKLYLTVKNPENEEEAEYLSKEIKRHFKPLLSIENKIEGNLLIFIIDGFAYRDSPVVKEMVEKKILAINPSVEVLTL